MNKEQSVNSGKEECNCQHSKMTICDCNCHDPKLDTESGWEIEFDKKFARINHIDRGQCAITDITGSKFEAHTENGLVTEVGGLESIKDFIKQTLAKREQEIVEKITKWKDNLDGNYEFVGVEEETVDTIINLITANK